MNKASKIIFGIALASLLAACGPSAVHVGGPFYLTYFETRDEMALFRCPNGSSQECAIDGLPNATIYAAGADERYIVVAQHPHKDSTINRNVTEYFYFARIKNEVRGYGLSPEKIIGPLTQAQFESEKQKLRLPSFSIKLKDLE